MIKILFDESKEVHYVYLSDVFDDVVNQGLDLKDLGVDKAISAPLMELIKQRIKPPEVEIEGALTITSYASDGVKRVAAAIAVFQKCSDDLKVQYKGGGQYLVRVKGPDYRTVEKELQSAITILEKYTKKQKLSCAFERIKA